MKKLLTLLALAIIASTAAVAQDDGIFTTIRASRGQDIYAACGLLSTAKKGGGL